MARVGRKGNSKTADAEPEVHPWRETRDNCPGDALLRRHLFRIVARPRNAAAIWERNGVHVTEAEALRLATAEGED